MCILCYNFFVENSTLSGSYILCSIFCRSKCAYCKTKRLLCRSKCLFCKSKRLKSLHEKLKFYVCRSKRSQLTLIFEEVSVYFFNSPFFMQLSYCINYAIRNTIGESMLRQSENLKHNRVLILYPIGYIFINFT